MTNQDAIKLIEHLKDEIVDLSDNEIQAFDLAIKALEDKPQGEWKVYARQGGIPISDYCTNCKYEMRWYKNKYNYCPNCGAKMLNQADVE